MKLVSNCQSSTGICIGAWLKKFLRVHIFCDILPSRAGLNQSRNQSTIFYFWRRLHLVFCWLCRNLIRRNSWNVNLVLIFGDTLHRFPQKATGFITLVRAPIINFINLEAYQKTLAMFRLPREIF